MYRLCLSEIGFQMNNSSKKLSIKKGKKEKNIRLANWPPKRISTVNIGKIKTKKKRNRSLNKDESISYARGILQRQEYCAEMMENMVEITS